MADPSDLFRQVVTFAELVERDAFNRPTLGPLQSARARVQPSRKVIRDANGSEHLTSHVVYTSAPITLQHRVWLPGENTADLNRARRPAAIDQLIDGAGVERYRKVYF